MAGNPNKLSQFWQELRRRRVIHVIIVYATASFVIIELVNNVYETLNLPDWTPALAIIILAIGFPIALIFSWIFDVTPKGLQKTKPAHKVKKEDKPVISNSWRIASYISFFVIVVLIILNIIPRSNNKEILEKSIAVLPFKNFSTEHDQDHMCLGLTDEIINHLFKIESFDKVVSLGSVMVYRETDKTTPEIAVDLDVNYILEGTYKKIGDQLRVTAQLIEAKNDKHLWQNEYDQPYKEIIAIQADIALQIADHIKIFITRSEKQRIQKIPTANQEAYELYRRGLYYYNLHTDFWKSAEYFEQAIHLDSTFALAYSSLAQCYQFIYRYSFRSEENTYSKAKVAALKALELDPSLGEAHAALGLIMAIEDWDIYGPEQVFKRAIKLSPGSPEVYSSFAQYLRWLGRYDECILYAKRALELDPQNPMAHQWLAVFYSYSGQYDKSNQQLGNVLHLNPDFFHAYLVLAMNYTFMGIYDKAIFYIDKALSFSVPIDELLFTSFQNWVYAKAGLEEKARKILEQMLTTSENQFVDPVYLAVSYTGLGEIDNAFSSLSKAFELHTGQMIYLRAYSDFLLKDLSSDPRYDELLLKVGFNANQIE